MAKREETRNTLIEETKAWYCNNESVEAFVDRILALLSPPAAAREPRTEPEHLAAAAQEIERLRAALKGLMPYRAHTRRCAYEMTEICTCGMRQAADSARRTLLTATPEDRNGR